MRVIRALLSFTLLGVMSIDAAEIDPSPRSPRPLEAIIPALSADEVALLKAQRPLHEQITAVLRLQAARDPGALEVARLLAVAEKEPGPASDLYVKLALASPHDALSPSLESDCDARSLPGCYRLAQLRLAGESADRSIDPAKRAVEGGCRYWGCYSTLARAYAAGPGLDEGLRYLRERARTARDPHLAGLAWLGAAELIAEQDERRIEAEEMMYAALVRLRSGEGRERAQILLGRLYAEEGYARESLAIAQHLVETYELQGRAREKGMALQNAGSGYIGLGHIREGLRVLEQALELFRDIGERRFEGFATENIAIAYHDLGDVQRSIAMHQKALAILREVHDQSSEAVVLSTLSTAYGDAGLLRNEIEALERGLEIARDIQDRDSEGLILGNLGGVYYKLGEQKRAIELFEAALAIARDVQDQIREGIVLGNLGQAFANQGNVQRAAELYQEALALHRKLENRYDEAVILKNLAVLHRRAGDTERARAALQQALVLIRGIGDRAYEGYLLGQLGLTEAESGRPEAGIEWFDQALAFYRTLQYPRDEVETRKAYARLLASLGRPSDALAQVDRAIIISEELLKGLSDVDLESDFFDASADLYGMRIAYLEQLAAGSAEARLEQSFEVAEVARARSFHHRLSLSRIDVTRGAPPEVVQQWQDARYAISRARLFMDTPEQSIEERYALEEMLEGAGSSGRTELQTADGKGGARGRTRGLLEQLRAGTLSKAQRRSLLEELASAREEQYQRAERALRDASPLYRSVVVPSPVGLRTIQAALDDRILVIAYLMGPDRSFAWAITRQEARQFSLPAEDTLSTQVMELRDRLEQQGAAPAEIAALAKPLYEALIQPVSDWLKPGMELIVVPDGSLGLLPFEALATRVSSAGMVDWLGVDHALVYAPSVTTWYAGRDRRQARMRGALLAIGNPEYPVDRCDEARAGDPASSGSRAMIDGRWSRLCYSHDELQAIRRSRRGMLLERRGDVYLEGAAATEASLRAVRLVDFDLIHFSTHGVAYPEAPERSAVVLGRTEAKPGGSSPQEDVSGGTARRAGPDRREATGEPQDGYLDLREITALQIDAGLVVLSACETAVGRKRRGEGVESLARGFLMAGAGQVLASQWQVSDLATARFMGRFFRELKRAPAEVALYRTRRAFILGEEALTVQDPVSGEPLRRRYDHPYFWAPFILTVGGQREPGPTSAIKP